MKKILITGASSGIGRGLALRLGFDENQLFLVARRISELEAVASEIREAHPGCRVESLSLDLSEDRNILELTKRIPEVDVAVLNAGLGHAGEFLKQDSREINQMLDINVKALTHLAHHYGRKMAEQGRGRIVLISSLASLIPTPQMAVYSATKAYVTALGEALFSELKEKGVAVTTVMPGGVKTEFHLKAGISDEMVKKFGNTLLTLEQVVESIIKALDSDRSTVIPGVANQLFSQVLKILPRQKVIGQAGKIYSKYITKN